MKKKLFISFLFFFIISTPLFPEETIQPPSSSWTLHARNLAVLPFSLFLQQLLTGVTLTRQLTDYWSFGIENTFLFEEDELTSLLGYSGAILQFYLPISFLGNHLFYSLSQSLGYGLFSISDSQGEILDQNSSLMSQFNFGIAGRWNQYEATLSFGSLAILKKVRGGRKNPFLFDLGLAYRF